MNRLANLKLGTKIYWIVGLLSVVALAIAGLGLEAMQTYNQQVRLMQLASERAVIGERVNSLIFSVVMDSRGIYISRDSAEAKKFGATLTKSLHDIDGLMGEWRNLMPPARQHEMDRALENVRQFNEFRTELVRLGVEEGAAKARPFGDNDANRTNRQNLNKEIDALALTNNAEIKTLKQAIDDHYATKMVELIALAVIGIICAVGLSIATVIGSIARPVTALTRIMKALAAGDGAVTVPGTERGDELGEMSRTVLVFKENLNRSAALEAEQREEQAKKERRQAAVEGFIVAFDASVTELLGALTAAATEMHATAEGMTETAAETARQATAVSSASIEASTNVQTVASAAEELSATVTEITRQVTQSATIARQAVDEANGTNTTMAGLAAAAQKIGDVVKLIQAIASQTNLLALNATIEAARAGEAGKGFAVVASEVKVLAVQTGKATEEISSQVAAIQAVSSQAVAAIQGIGGTVGQVSEIATAIAGAVEEQAAATREISRNTVEAAKGTELVSANIGGVNQAAADTGSAATQVRTASQELSQRAEQLRGTVDSFLANIRAA